MKKILLCFLLLTSLRSFSQTLESDRLVLVNLYNATNGNYWNNRSGWSVPGNPGDNPCGWSGISCEAGRVTSIALSGNNLVGTIPESVTTMDALKYFYVASNSISGNIPSSIGNLTNLRHLEMSSNAELKGEIPASIGNLQLLELLSINDTKIGGNIPFGLGTLTKLKTIGLSSNQLFGPIPSNLGNLSQLGALFLDRNQLSGEIPNELGNATSLTSLGLGYNQLIGPIPSSIGNLTNLGILYLESNDLSGPLSGLSGISSSCFINITFNRFTFEGIEPNIAKLDYYSPQKTFSLTNEGGILRANVGGTAANNVYRWYKNGILVATNNITDLYSPTGEGTYRAQVSNSVAPSLTMVSEDYIIGPDNLESDRQALLAFYLETNGSGWTNRSGWNYPGNVGDSPCGWFGVSCTAGRVTGLSMSANNLNGTITPNIKNLKKLKILGLSSNSSLRGEIPSSLGEISELESVIIQSNSLTGTIPTTLGNLLKLRWLDLSSNHLGGAIPSNIGNLGALEVLALAQNEFGGNIPLEIGGLTNLTFLSLYDNLVTGQIPSQLGNLSKLYFFDLSVNQLTGHIPVELGNLTQLQVFNLNLNQLSGSIPTSLINATKLEIFSVGYNSLIGSIPSNIGNLTKMRVLAMAGNQLDGSLPSSLGNFANLEQVFLDHNNFTGVFPGGAENWNKITILRANHNRFDGIVSLSSVPMSAEVNFNNNFLTFGALEPNISKIDQYFSQANIPITVNGATLSVNAGGTIANNTYSWYRNNFLVATNSGINTYTMTESGEYWVLVSNSLVPSLTLISLRHTYNNALPVRLVNFTAKKSGVTNLLRWSTTMEVNNSGFEIERSVDARNFEKIGFRNGKGVSKNLETYQFVDENPLLVSYYRLKQIDIDGKSTYTRIVQVSSAEQVFKLYPNPAKDVFTIESTGSGKSIDIYDLKGTKIFEKPVLNSQTVSTMNWPAGTYIIKHGELSKKIVIAK
ncbi:leucine-rich repeat domain-containing protein [Dyadobacter diqingensis]|uniref:leucine-rich repeat domain-containing protein n=1 Tax=Dyadobacter diqingensis TaxID=2938121 RepID=UPI0020C19156|nr:T9SS type A sorting domain-containing protein [Dyadobacter diqingensis]